ncbi:MAG: DUF6268 family outer membrane beta-barrel protein [Bacteroidales bacterium]|nr:DUF6268 family outer membrane beta-barrel protein [Bacteroidales bacterium]
MKRLLTIILILSASVSVFAQNRFDVFYVAGNYNFMSSPAVNAYKNCETAIMSNLSLPIVLKDSSIWYTSVDYQNFQIPTSTILLGGNNVDKFNLHGFIFRTGYIHKFNSKQSLQILFAPRFMGDFNASFSKSLQLGGILMYEKVKSENYTWRVGVLYNQEFFGTYIVPVFYLDWNMTSKIKVKGLLPVYAKIYTQASEKLSYGLHFIGLTTTYRISEPDFENFYVDRRSIDVSAFANINIFDNIFLETRAGYSLSRDYGLFAEDDKIDLGLPLVNIGDDRTRANNEFEGSPFIHLRLIYSLPVN